MRVLSQVIGQTDQDERCRLNIVSAPAKRVDHANASFVDLGGGGKRKKLDKLTLLQNNLNSYIRDNRKRKSIRKKHHPKDVQRSIQTNPRQKKHHPKDVQRSIQKNPRRKKHHPKEVQRSIQKNPHRKKHHPKEVQRSIQKKPNHRKHLDIQKNKKQENKIRNQLDFDKEIQRIRTLRK